ncbi:MAG: cell wall-active antibiotics response protein [Lachnospiraceae bacterium]|nr:cell wall-active antibiotics response protein [Lachnospiraceae bacterium]
MKKGSTGAVWGLLMIVGGILLAGKILHWFEFELFFNGWWSLFLIIPSAVNFMTGQKNRSRSLRCLIFGVMLLMAAQGFIEYRMLFPLLVAAFLILSGCRMMFSGGKEPQGNRRGEKKRGHAGSAGFAGSDEVHDWRREADSKQYEDASNYSFEEEYDYFEKGEQSSSFAWNDYANREEYRRDGRGDGEFEKRGMGAFTGSANRNGRCACTSICMGKEINYAGEVFEGAVLSCIMGAIDLDLSGAVIYHDVTVEAILIMGGIDIIVPKDVRVVVQRGLVLGSVDNHLGDRPLLSNAPTVFIKPTCIFGGMDIV